MTLPNTTSHAWWHPGPTIDGSIYVEPRRRNHTTDAISLFGRQNAKSLEGLADSRSISLVGYNSTARATRCWSIIATFGSINPAGILVARSVQNWLSFYYNTVKACHFCSERGTTVPKVQYNLVGVRRHTCTVQCYWRLNPDITLRTDQKS